MGDNVGDCAGMAADLFESYEVTLVASIILGVAAFNSIGANPALGLVFPLAARAIGVIASIAGVFAVKATPGRDERPQADQQGFLVAGSLTLVGTLLVALIYVGNDKANAGWKCFAAVAIGLVLAQLISRLTEYFTGTEHEPGAGDRRSPPRPARPPSCWPARRAASRARCTPSSPSPSPSAWPSPSAAAT